MIMATKAKSPLLGRWRITWMDQWDQDFVDEETEGYFEMDAVQGRGWATLAMGDNTAKRANRSR
jgi:hypothetical protein